MNEDRFEDIVRRMANCNVEYTDLAEQKKRFMDRHALMSVYRATWLAVLMVIAGFILGLLFHVLWVKI